MAVKLDISKAYDRVEWKFLEQIMIKLGFDTQWIQLAMETVCTTSYFVLINGEPQGYITFARGILQDDHLSPYLFILCVERLSSMIRREVSRQRLHGVFSCTNGVCISHLLFTDDSLIFYQATVENAITF